MQQPDHLCEVGCCCYDRPMPSADLLQAISRLDQAVSRAEANMSAARMGKPDKDDIRNAVVREAIAELDGIIGALRKKDDG